MVWSKADVSCPKRLSLFNLLTRPSMEFTRVLLSELTSRGGVQWDPWAATWLVCGRDEVPQVLGDARFSSQRIHAAARGYQSVAGGVDMHEVAARMMLLRDGSEHQRLKKIVRSVLSPSRIQALEPWMRGLIRELLPANMAGSVDFASTVALRFPLLVVARLLGLPEDDLPMVLRGSDAMTDIIGGLAVTVAPQIHRDARTLYDYVLDLIHARRSAPGDDAVSAFVAAADEEGGLEDIDIAANLLMLIASGHQTMPGLLSLSLLDSLTTGAALSPDESLAWVTPSRFVGRVATEEVLIGGCRIASGDRVVVLLAAANWEALRHREAGQGPIDSQKPLRHWSFGHGRHRCAGASLAELESAVVFDRLSELRERLFLAGKGQWNGNINLPALTSLPIGLHPAFSAQCAHPAVRDQSSAPERSA